MKRRLEDRIRALCALGVKARNDIERCRFFAQLQEALHEHNQRLKRVAFLKLVQKDNGFQERRTA
jgi:hypothetical protein